MNVRFDAAQIQKNSPFKKTAAFDAVSVNANTSIFNSPEFSQSVQSELGLSQKIPKNGKLTEKLDLDGDGVQETTQFSTYENGILVERAQRSKDKLVVQQFDDSGAIKRRLEFLKTPNKDTTIETTYDAKGNPRTVHTDIDLGNDGTVDIKKYENYKDGKLSHMQETSSGLQKQEVYEYGSDGKQRVIYSSELKTKNGKTLLKVKHHSETTMYSISEGGVKTMDAVGGIKASTAIDGNTVNYKVGTKSGSIDLNRLVTEQDPSKREKLIALLKKQPARLFHVLQQVGTEGVSTGVQSEVSNGEYSNGNIYLNANLLGEDNFSTATEALFHETMHNVDDFVADNLNNNYFATEGVKLGVQAGDIRALSDGEIRSKPVKESLQESLAYMSQVFFSPVISASEVSADMLRESDDSWAQAKEKIQNDRYFPVDLGLDQKAAMIWKVFEW